MSKSLLLDPVQILEGSNKSLNKNAVLITDGQINSGIDILEKDKENLEEVKIVKMELGSPDESGRRKPEIKINRAG